MKPFVSVLTIAAALLLLCACSPEMPVINTTPIGGEAVSTPVTSPTRPAPGTRLTLAELMGEMGATMQWSVLSNYEHTQQDTVTAIFPVSVDEGRECTLTVEFDDMADLLTTATLSYGDVSISVLTDDTMVLRDIMRAVDEG